MRYRTSNKRLRTLSDWPSVLLTLAVCLLCRISYYVAAPADVLPDWASSWTFADRILTDRLASDRLSACLAGFVITLLAAYLLQRISDAGTLIREHTRLPFMLFLALTGASAGLLPVRIAVVLLCLVLVIHELFRSYQQPEATGHFFNAGALMAFVGLIIPQIVWFVPLLWIGMYRFRSLSARSFLASLAGMFIIGWIVAAWCLWRHDFSMIAALSRELADFHILSAEKFGYSGIGSLVVVAMLVVSFFHIRAEAFGNSVRVRQMLFFLMNMSVWSFVPMLLYGHSDALPAVLCLPASVLIACFLENLRYGLRFVLYYFILLSLVASFMLQLWTSW
ncbi:MAG: DUF6427 family protein [Tannerella sp.]|jgi:hypothetical protein|nr:DUF6427 family protein [Tannerella sp.]